MTSLLNQNILKPISPVREMGAYESLWFGATNSFKKIANIFKDNPNTLPSELVSDEDIDKAVNAILQKLATAKIKNFGVRVFNSIDYPAQLRDAENPLELFYYRGTWDLVYNPKRIAIVGARSASPEGIKRAKKLSRLLVEDGYTIVSGLAKGIDTAAHTSAIEAGGQTIAVIGTPITEYYPPENKALQEKIATKYLLISQVPFLKYDQQTYRGNRLFFPERNVTMSALTQATVIVEAGETSGSLTQAKAAIEQGRKLFILDNCFYNKNISWPEKYLKRGAIRVRDIDDIKRELSDEASSD